MAMMDEREVSYKNTGDSLLLKALGKYPKLRIIDIFLTNPLMDFSKKGLVRELRMSKQTLYKYFKDLEELGDGEGHKKNRACHPIQTESGEPHG
jgi:type III secretory pathway component EscU